MSQSIIKKKCSYCSKEVGARGFGIHLLSHTSPQSIGHGYCKTTVVCPICNKEINSRAIGGHIFHAHIPKQKLDLKCSFCDKHFTNKTALTNHENYSHKGKIFVG